MPALRYMKRGVRICVSPILQQQQTPSLPRISSLPRYSQNKVIKRLIVMSTYKADAPGRYAKKFLDPQGPGDTRPTALEIVKDEGLENQLVDKVVLITGCSSGIGIETARAIAATGARVFCGVRDLKRGQNALEGILKPGVVELLEMDLNSLESVRKAAADLTTRSNKRLNILINNAGIMAIPTNVKTVDGHESQFGVNFLSHFLLFQLLKPLLLQSSIPTFPSRVVNVSSVGHRYSGAESGPVRFDDYGFDASPEAYTPFGAYAQAKTAEIWMANEIERKYGRGSAHPSIHAWSLHPGGIKSNLQNHLSSMQAMMEQPEIKKHMLSTAQGAATTVLAAVGKEFEGKGGKYLDMCEVAGPTVEAGPGAPGYGPFAYNEEGEKRLWKDACRIVGVSDD